MRKRSGISSKIFVWGELCRVHKDGNYGQVILRERFPNLLLVIGVLEGDG